MPKGKGTYGSKKGRPPKKGTKKGKGKQGMALFKTIRTAQRRLLKLLGEALERRRQQNGNQ